MNDKILIPLLLFFLMFCFACTRNDKCTGTPQTSAAERVKNLNRLALHYENKNQPDSAFYYHNTARVVLLENKDHKAAALKLLAMANVQFTAADYLGAENTVKEALPLLKDSTSLSRAYLLLAAASKNLFNHNIAINYYNKAYNLTKDPVKKLDIKHHIGCNYMHKTEYGNAAAILKTALASANKNTNPVVKARLLDHLGHAYFKQDNDKGLDEMLEALKIRRGVNDLIGTFSSLVHLSEFYNDKNNDQAKSYAAQAYEAAERLNSTEFLLKALGQLVNSSEGEELRQFSGEYILSEAKLRKNRLVLKSKLDKILIDSRKQEAETLRKSNEKEHRLSMEVSDSHNKLLIVCLIFTIVSSVLVYYVIKMRHKRERLMEGYITETRIAKKVHDEIANEIYGAINYISTNEDLKPDKKEKLLTRLDDIYLLTRNISRETTNIETGYQFPEHLKLMLSSYSGSGVNVIIKGLEDIEWENIEPLKKIATYRSLQELMVNMKKHSGAALVVLDFSSSRKKIRITYTDNGQGASPEMLAQKNGLHNIEERINAIEGKIKIDTSTDKGFHIQITYPAVKSYV